MIKILTICDSYKHFDVSIKEYEKRLGKKIEIIKLRPSKKDNIDEIIKDETNIIKDYLQKNGNSTKKIIFSIEGKSFSTIEFLDFIEKTKNNYSNILFIIGGPFGLDYKELKSFIDFEISLSKMTFPHIEALLILLEQLYRIDCIKQGKSYHY